MGYPVHTTDYRGLEHYSWVYVCRCHGPPTRDMHVAPMLTLQKRKVLKQPSPTLLTSRFSHPNRLYKVLWGVRGSRIGRGRQLGRGVWLAARDRGAEQTLAQLLWYRCCNIRRHCSIVTTILTIKRKVNHVELKKGNEECRGTHR